MSRCRPQRCRAYKSPPEHAALAMIVNLRYDTSSSEVLSISNFFAFRSLCMATSR